MTLWASAAIQAVTLVCYVIWAEVLTVRRRWARPGSLDRFHYNTAERILRWPAAVNALYPTIYATLVRPDLTGAEVAIYIVVTAWASFFYLIRWRLHREIDRDDDDDWFKKTRRRAAGWVRGLGRHPVKVTA